MVTHDQGEAMTMSTRIGIMSEGYLEQVSQPSEIYEFPNSKFVANFIGTSAIFEGTIESISTATSYIQSNNHKTTFVIDRAIEGVAGQKIWVGIRPEKIITSKTPPEGYDKNHPQNCIKGKVKDIAYMGGLSTYHVELDNVSVIKSIDFNIERNNDNPTWDDSIYLSWEPESVMVLYS